MHRKKPLLFALIGLTTGILLVYSGCKNTIGESSLHVSFNSVTYYSDIVNWTDSVIPYDTASANLLYETPDTFGGIEPVCVIDSYHITYYDRVTGNLIKFEKWNNSSEVLTTLKFPTRVEVPANTEKTITFALVPSWLKAFYKPLYDMWYSGTPDLVLARVDYKFFAHELLTSKKFVVPVSIQVDIADYAEE